MSDFLLYLGQSSLCLVALYLIYKVAMSNETLHRFNRVVLLSMLPLSALLPLCRIKIVKVVDVASQQSLADAVAGADEAVAAQGFGYMAMLYYVLAVVFLLGVIFMLVRLAVSIISVWRIISSCEQSELAGGVSLTVVDSLPTPFSWFNHIVVAKDDMAECRDIILTHELAHVRLCHSCDIMIIDLALCVWWFNPALWLLRRELQSLHEYQADEAVLNRGVDAKTYQMMLIKRAVGSRLHSVANCLNHSNLKNRITMMCKKSSSRWSAAKALLVLPMVAIALGAFATTVYLPREVQVKVTENSSNEQTSDVVSVIHLKSDKIVIDGKEVTLAELKEHISDFLAGATTVQISADFNVKMGDVADLREVLRQNNVTKVNYLQLKPEKPDTVIKVKNTSPKSVIEQAQGVDKENQPAVVIDGRKVAYKRLEKIKPEDIDHIDVVKSHGENGTIYITTKNAKKDKEKVGVVIGGMEVPEYQLEMLDPSQISSMSVVRGAGGGTTIYVNTNDGQ